MDKDDELARRREVERARHAQELLRNPLWEEAWTALESKLTAAWKSSQTGQAERRELIYMQLRATEEIRGYIIEALETGRLAEMQLDEHNRERHRIEDRGA